MSSSEELVFALQREVERLKVSNETLQAKVKDLKQINESHKKLNGSLRKDLTNLKAQVNIKVMNGQWHMSNDIDADDLEVKEKTDE